MRATTGPMRITEQFSVAGKLYPQLNEHAPEFAFAELTARAFNLKKATRAPNARIFIHLSLHREPSAVQSFRADEPILILASGWQFCGVPSAKITHFVPTRIVPGVSGRAS